MVTQFMLSWIVAAIGTVLIIIGGALKGAGNANLGNCLVYYDGFWYDDNCHYQALWNASYAMFAIGSVVFVAGLVLFYLNTQKRPTPQPVAPSSLETGQYNPQPVQPAPAVQQPAAAPAVFCTNCGAQKYGPYCGQCNRA